jgi:hypothetical protein
MGERNTLNVRKSFVFMEDKELVVPNLLSEGEDAMIVVLEPSMRRSKKEELYHKQAAPPESIFTAETFSQPTNEDLNSLLGTILVGGQPLYKGDILIKPQHDLIEYGDVDDLKVLAEDRKSVIEEVKTLEKTVSTEVKEYTKAHDYPDSVELPETAGADLKEEAETNAEIEAVKKIAEEWQKEQDTAVKDTEEGNNHDK